MCRFIMFVEYSNSDPRWPVGLSKVKPCKAVFCGQYPATSNFPKKNSTSSPSRFFSLKLISSSSFLMFFVQGTQGTILLPQWQGQHGALQSPQLLHHLLAATAWTGNVWEAPFTVVDDVSDVSCLVMVASIHQLPGGSWQPWHHLFLVGVWSHGMPHQSLWPCGNLCSMQSRHMQHGLHSTSTPEPARLHAERWTLDEGIG